MKKIQIRYLSQYKLRVESMSRGGADCGYITDEDGLTTARGVSNHWKGK